MRNSIAVACAGLLAVYSLPGLASVQVTSSAPCSLSQLCITSVSGISVSGLPTPFDVTFEYAAGLDAAFAAGPDFDASHAFLAGTALVAELNSPSSGAKGPNSGFLTPDGHHGGDALIPYISDGADSYLRISQLGAGQGYAWWLGTLANFGPDLTDIYAHFGAEVPEPSTLGLLGLGLAGAAYARRKRPI